MTESRVSNDLSAVASGNPRRVARVVDVLPRSPIGNGHRLRAWLPRSTHHGGSVVLSVSTGTIKTTRRET
jgi:hypothetical protein